MNTLNIDIDNTDANSVAQTVETLRAGGVVLAPSDTCYGLIADIGNKDAIDKVYRIKGRDFNKPLSIAVDFSFYENYVAINDIQREIFENMFPGRHTAILPKSELVPSRVVSGLDYVGIRIMDFQFIIDVLKKFGSAIITTSANTSGVPPKYSVNEVLEDIDQDLLDLVVDAEKLPLNNPSRVVKVHEDGSEEVFRN